jgi:uncharacterized protein (TIGR04551 family)
MNTATRLVMTLCLAAPAAALAQEGAEEAADGAAEATEQAAEEAAAEATEAAEEAAAEATEATEEAGEATTEATEQAADATPTPAPTPAATPAPANPATPARTFEQYATANPAAPTTRTWDRATTASQEPERTYPFVEWHGYFRARHDSFWNLDLDTNGTSPILPPIEALRDPGTGTAFEDSEPPDTLIGEDGEEAEQDLFLNGDAEHIAGANIRFRLRPTFHVTEKARIHLEMNILDNLVLGSTPDGYNEGAGARAGRGGLRIDMPVIGFTGTQEPPNYYNAQRSSISVTQAYGEVNAFFGTIRVGRMASQWGLGILANGGGSYSSLDEPRVSYRGLSMQGHGCMDCDYGDYVDRAMFVTNLFDTYLALAWDFNYAGPTDINPAEYFGQPREISNYDDVRSYVVSVFQRPLRPEEIAARNRTLKELRRPTFDWGAYFVYRVQRLSPEVYNAYGDLTDYVWLARGAKAYIPDVWFRLQSEPRFRRRLRLEGEFAAILGKIQNANPDPLSNYNPVRPRDIRQFGAALEFEYVNLALATGINTGFASGRTLDRDVTDAETPIGFGVRDQWSPSDNETQLTNFRFDRNYFVDTIMFREIVGAITNAVYFNPFFQYDLFAKQNDTLGVRLDLVSAIAVNPETTPSGESWYGLETDVSVYWREPRFGTDLTAGFFLPGTVFDAVEGRPRLTTTGSLLGRQAPYDSDTSATPAWTVQGRFFWAF